MMDAILMALKDSVEEAVWKSSRIPPHRKDLVVEVAVKAVSDSFKRCFASDDMPSLVCLFSGVIDLKGKLMVNNIKNLVKSDLMVKAGVGNESEDIAKYIVDEVITSVWNRINTQDDSEFTLNNLIYIYSGRAVDLQDRGIDSSRQSNKPFLAKES